MHTHVDKNGKSYKLSELEDSHLDNIIRRIERKAKEGLTVFYGGGSCPEDFWGDTETLTGKDVLDWMGHDKYIAERKKKTRFIILTLKTCIFI